MFRWIREHKIITGIVLVILIVVVVFAVSLHNNGGSGKAGQAANGTVTAAESATTSGVSGIKGFFIGILNFRSIQEENESLRKQVDKLEQQLSEEEMSQEQLSQLKDLSEALNYQAAEEGTLIAADIASFDGSTWINTITIHRGSADGIEVDDVVVNGTGLVGRVTECGKHWAKIVSLLDDDNKTSFKVSRDSDILGMLEGDGEGSLTGYVFDADAGIMEGDVLLTSGMGIYPAGIEIGTVTEVNYNNDTQLKEIKVKPSVNFKSLQKVAVIV